MDILEEIEWRDEWTLGSPSVDEQHKQVIRLFNKFVRSLSAPELIRQSEIRSAISTLIIYYEIHNRSEEALMIRVGYPRDMMEAHVRGHESVNMDILSLIEFFNSNESIDLNLLWLKGVIRSWTPFIPLSQDDIDLIHWIQSHPTE